MRRNTSGLVAAATLCRTLLGLSLSPSLLALTRALSLPSRSPFGLITVVHGRRSDATVAAGVEICSVSVGKFELRAPSDLSQP